MSDHQTFRSELTKLLPRLHRYARVLTPGQSDADDLLQATCERGLSKWQQFVPGTKLDAWMFTVMSSVWKNELRSRAIRQGQGFVEVETLQNSTESAAEGNIYLDQVLKMVMGLPETQRATVLMVYVEGMSYQEAADVLGIAIGTVMSRLARARITLAEQINAAPQLAGQIATRSTS